MRFFGRKNETNDTPSQESPAHKPQDAAALMAAYEDLVGLSGVPGGLEERMGILEVLLDIQGAPSLDKYRALATYITEGGAVELHGLLHQLKGMSPRARASAFLYLTSVPEYTMKGLRYVHNPEGDAEASGCTAYQTVIDMLRAEADPDWATAMQGLRLGTSPVNVPLEAKEGVIAAAIEALNRLRLTVSPHYSWDLAVAYYRLAEILVEMGNEQGAKVAIEKSVAFLWTQKRHSNGEDESWRHDYARALLERGILRAGDHELADAMRDFEEASALLRGLAEQDANKWALEFSRSLTMTGISYLQAAQIFPPKEANAARLRARAAFDEAIAVNVALAGSLAESSGARIAISRLVDHLQLLRSKTFLD